MSRCFVIPYSTNQVSNFLYHIPNRHYFQGESWSNLQLPLSRWRTGSKSLRQSKKTNLFLVIHTPSPFKRQSASSSWSGRGDVRGLGYSQERGLPLLGSIFPVRSYGIVVLPALSTDYSCCSLQSFERKCAWAVIVALEMSMAAHTIDRLGRSWVTVHCFELKPPWETPLTSQGRPSYTHVLRLFGRQYWRVSHQDYALLRQWAHVKYLKSNLSPIFASMRIAPQGLNRVIFLCLLLDILQS